MADSPSGPNREFIERVAAFVEKLPPRGLSLEQPSSPLFRLHVHGEVDRDAEVHGDPRFDPDTDVLYDSPSLPLQAFRFGPGSYYGPGDRVAAGGIGAAVAAVAERDGVDLAAAERAGREAEAAGLSGEQRFVEVALGVEADTAEALVRGTGSLHELCPAEAVTGPYAASALRAAADGRWGHQVWCDVTPQVAPEHRGGPRVDPSAYVDPQAFVAPDVVVGRGAYVGGGAVVLAGSSVGARTRIDDRAVVGPRTELGDGVWVGSDAHVRDARVRAGSVVEDTGIVLGSELPPNSVVVAGQVVGDGGDGVSRVARTLPPGEVSAQLPGAPPEHDPLLDPFPGALVMAGARVADTAYLAPGSVACPGAVIGPNAHVGPGVVVGSGALVREDVHMPGGAERTIVGVGGIVREHAHLAPGAVVRAKGAVPIGYRLGPDEATSCSVQPPGVAHRLDGPAAPLRTSRWERWQRYQSAGGASSDVPAAIARVPDHRVHPTAAVHLTARLSHRTVVGPGVVIGPGVVTRGACDIRGDAAVGAGTELTDTVVSHGVRVGEECVLQRVTLGGASGISGPSSIGSRCRLQDASIGAGARLGDRCLALQAQVHAGAGLGSDVRLGPGSVVGALSRVGDHVHFASSATTDRACVVGSGVSVRSGAKLGQACHVGDGSIVGHDANVGPGARLARGVELGRGVSLPAQARVAEGVYVPACSPGELPAGVSVPARAPAGGEPPAPAPGSVAAGASRDARGRGPERPGPGRVA